MLGIEGLLLRPENNFSFPAYFGPTRQVQLLLVPESNRKNKHKKNRIKCLSVTGPGLVGCVTRELYGLRLILGDEIVINNIRIKLGDHARAGKYMYKNYNISFGKYKNYATYQKRVNRCHYHIDWQRGRVWR